MILDIQGLHKSFGKNEILKGIDFSVEEGQILGVIGSSGSGKSTLLRCINFLEHPEKGRYTFAGKMFNAESAGRDDILYMRRHTAMVFQQFNLFKYKTAMENVMEGLVHVKGKTREEAEETAGTLLRDVGLSDRMTYYPRELSGGQQQRVAIARALALDPKVILFDEPTSALDPEMVGEVLEVIGKLADAGKTMIIVSHEMNFVYDIADRAIFMDEGLIIEEGPAKKLLWEPQQERTQKFLKRANIRYDYVI